MSDFGKDIHYLQLCMGSLRDSLKSAYKEATTIHSDRGLFEHFIKRLSEDFHEADRALRAFETITFIKGKGTK